MSPKENPESTAHIHEAGIQQRYTNACSRVVQMSSSQANSDVETEAETETCVSREAPPL